MCERERESYTSEIESMLCRDNADGGQVFKQEEYASMFDAQIERLRAVR